MNKKKKWKSSKTDQKSRKNSEVSALSITGPRVRQVETGGSWLLQAVLAGGG